MKDIGVLRALINAVDDKLLALLAERMQLAKEVGEYKKAHNQPILVPAREQEVIDRLCTKAQSLGIHPELVSHIYPFIFQESRNIQTETKERD